MAIERKQVVTVFIEGDPKKATFRKVSRLETASEARKRVREERVRQANEKYKKENTEKLNCDACGLSMGRVYANDLEGSRFYHAKCIK